MDADKVDLYGDGVGYVRLVDRMGDEFTPAEDARTSTLKGRLGPEKDAKLQETLTRNRHTSPFEGTVLKLELCVPLFVLRELDRHRTTEKTADGDLFELVTPEEDGRKWFARSEASARYVVLPDAYYHPREVRAQDGTNRQGSAEAPSVSPEVAGAFLARGRALALAARELYAWATSSGIERGLARIYNTQNQYTVIRLTGSLKNWFDFLKLRLPANVLWECREAARAIERILSEQFPTPWRQWVEHARDAVTLSKGEAEELRNFFRIAVWDRLDTGADVVRRIFEKVGAEYKP